jgi:mRNA interferase MazF
MGGGETPMTPIGSRRFGMLPDSGVGQIRIARAFVPRYIPTILPLYIVTIIYGEKALTMAALRFVSRGEVYMADLDPYAGSEQGGVRPVVIIQNNVGNRYSSTTIIAPITSRKKPDLPVHTALDNHNGLLRDSIVLSEQIRTIDKIRLSDYVCTLSKDEMRAIDEAIMISTGICVCQE